MLIVWFKLQGRTRNTDIKQLSGLEPVTYDYQERHR